MLDGTETNESVSETEAKVSEWYAYEALDRYGVRNAERATDYARKGTALFGGATAMLWVYAALVSDDLRISAFVAALSLLPGAFAGWMVHQKFKAASHETDARTRLEATRRELD